MALFSERMGYGRVKSSKNQLSEWDRDRLERFVQVGFFHFKRQIESRLNAYSFEDNYGRKTRERMREEIRDAVMEEILVLSEVLIVLALEERIIDRKALEQNGAAKRGRSILITEEECK